MSIVLQRVADISVAEIASRPTVLDAAEAVGCVYDFDKHPYFVWMRDPTTRLEDFRASQAPYRHFVEHFSRAIAAVLSRVPSMEHRLATVFSNLAEEHGQGALVQSHKNTFVEYLRAIGVRGADLERECPLRVAIAYEGLLGFCLTNPPEMGAAAMGIVEYTHIKIATMLAHTMHDRFWGNIEAQHHYRLHAQIDADHALDLFAICEEGWISGPMRRRIAYAMVLGAQMWWTLFDSMCPAESIAASTSDSLRSLLEVGSMRMDRPLVRRPHPRIECELSVLVRSADGPPLATTATSISACGMLLIANTPGRLDADVELTITFPGRAHPVVAGGSVRYRVLEEETQHIGVEFVFASDAERAAVVDAVRALAQGGADAPPPTPGSRRARREGPPDAAHRI